MPSRTKFSTESPKRKPGRVRSYHRDSPGWAELTSAWGVVFTVSSLLGMRGQIPSTGRRHTSGQSLVEFGLVVPILLVLFVAIADFSRVFAAGVAVEAATRNAAEAAANQYLANPPDGDLSVPATGSDQTYYDNLRSYAAGVVCAELRDLPSTNYDSVTQTCPDMPLVMFCVHDGADGGCGSLASPGSGVTPAQCGDLSNPALTNGQSTNADGSHPRSIEVRTCYLFRSVLHLPLFDLGDVWLQRTRTFAIACYFVLGTDECG